MRKLKSISTFDNHLIKSSIPLTLRSLRRIEALLIASRQQQLTNGSASKRMNCSSNWLMLRQGISIRVLIQISSSPKQVWVIHRRELDKACKAIKQRNLG